MTVRLQYRFETGQTYVYERRAKMVSRRPSGEEATGNVVARQVWRVVENRPGLTILEATEEVTESLGPLAKYFPQFQKSRKLYLDECGFLPHPGEDYPTLSAFPGLLEESVEAAESWSLVEQAPNWDSPLEIAYFLDSLEGQMAVLSCQAGEKKDHRAIEIRGTFHFNVQQGRLQHSLLLVENRLKDETVVRVTVKTQFQR